MKTLPGQYFNCSLYSFSLYAACIHIQVIYDNLQEKLPNECVRIGLFGKCQQRLFIQYRFGGQRLSSLHGPVIVGQVRLK